MVQLYKDTRKLLNEFEIIFRSTQCGPTLVSTNQQYIHSAKYKIPYQLNSNIILTKFIQKRMVAQMLEEEARLKEQGNTKK